MIEHLSIATGKGSLFHVVYEYAEGVFADVREVAAWDAAQFGNDFWFLAHGMGAVRLASALTKEKIGVEVLEKATVRHVE